MSTCSFSERQLNVSFFNCLEIKTVMQQTYAYFIYFSFMLNFGLETLIPFIKSNLKPIEALTAQEQKQNYRTNTLRQ